MAFLYWLLDINVWDFWFPFYFYKGLYRLSSRDMEFGLKNDSSSTNIHYCKLIYS